MPKKKSRLSVYLACLVVLLGLLIIGALQVRRIEADALLLADTGRGAIKLFSEMAAGYRELDLERIATCYAETYNNPQESLWEERLSSERDGVKVHDWQTEASISAGKEAVLEQISRYLKTVDVIDRVKVKLDVVEEIQDTDRAVVRSLLWLRGRRGNELFEAKVNFRMWVENQSGMWKIDRQELLEGVTVTGDGTGFADIAANAGLDFSAGHNPLFSTDEWRLERFGIAKYAGAGVSAVDYDEDGWADLFFADGAGFRLYRNNTSNEGKLSFTDVTAEAGLPLDLPGTHVGLFADLDNDGDKDLFLGRIAERNHLFRNEGDGTFTEVPAQPSLEQPFLTVAAAADYDEDGDLDLYLGRYLDPRTKLPTTLIYTRNGEGNSLLRNDGDFRFTDVTEEAGVREGGLTLGVSWGDLDRDGDLDLYVANDFGRNALFRNEGNGTFTDFTEESGTLDIGYGMSVSFGDVDNDSDLDIYVSNVHSAQRWYGQAATLYNYFLTSLKQGTIRDDFPLYREISTLTGFDWNQSFYQVTKGNSLHLNDGTGRFIEVAEKAKVNPFGWYWGSTFLDYDNDGRLDIYAANGWISGRTQDDL
jgi:hypothetical protein